LRVILYFLLPGLEGREFPNVALAAVSEGSTVCDFGFGFIFILSFTLGCETEAL